LQFEEQPDLANNVTLFYFLESLSCFEFYRSVSTGNILVVIIGGIVAVFKPTLKIVFDRVLV
jgi:hypothetical protein